ncbi:MAG: hypothetical protein Fues2KO_54360 [Fuerstiella sp.]
MTWGGTVIAAKGSFKLLKLRSLLVAEDGCRIVTIGRLQGLQRRRSYLKLGVILPLQSLFSITPSQAYRLSDGLRSLIFRSVRS